MIKKGISLFEEAKFKVLDTNIIVLYIGENSTLLIADSEGKDIKILPYGSKSITDEYFKHTPPTESEIEMAITKVEDEIMPLVSDIRANNYQLVSFDERLQEIKNYTLSHNGLITVADVEDIFSRLAAIVTGRPASMDVLPTENDFLSYVLILREVMHHLKFKDIRLYKK